MEGFIRFITDPQNLLSLGVGVLVFATVLTLLSSMTGGVKLDKRMKAVAAIDGTVLEEAMSLETARAA